MHFAFQMSQLADIIRDWRISWSTGTFFSKVLFPYESSFIFLT